MDGWRQCKCTTNNGRVGGYAADAVTVGSQIVRHGIGADINHRGGGRAANPTDANWHYMNRRPTNESRAARQACTCFADPAIDF